VIGTTVELDGTQSWDPDGDDITYSWTIITVPAGSSAVLSDPTSATPTFVADVNGDYTIELTVSDPWTSSASDSLLVSFTNIAPVADAGVNQSVAVGDTVDLDGSGCSDANGDPLTHSWSIVSAPAGSSCVLTSETLVQTSFVADLAGTYVVSLTVNDGYLDSDASTVTTVATSTQNEVTEDLDRTIDTINGLDPDDFKNTNMQNTLTNKINAVLEKVDQGLYQEALDKLENDILKRTDGCAESGTPDKNDWIEDCDSQNQVYPIIMETIGLLEELI
jgi:hypothetical protein